MKEIILNIFSKILNFIQEIPLTSLLVGVVVPIVAAWVSYFLAERAVKKKEYNRLYVQIELLKRELVANGKEIEQFILYFQEKKALEKDLEFPFIPLKSALIEMLDVLEDVKNDYFYFGKQLFDRPIKVYALAQKKEDIDKELNKIESDFNYYDDEYLEKSKKIKVSKLKRKGEKIVKEIKEYQERDIYKDFSTIQLRFERLIDKNMFEKMDYTEDNFILLKYIYECIEEFNKRNNKNKDDVLELLKKLVIFEITSDIIEDDNFNQDQFDLYYRGYERPDGIEKKLYDLFEKYYKYVVVRKKLPNYSFEFNCIKWSEISSDFVIINDRKMYIDIMDLYEKIEQLNLNKEEHNLDKLYENCIQYDNKIKEIIFKLEEHEKKLNKKCK